MHKARSIPTKKTARRDFLRVTAAAAAAQFVPGFGFVGCSKSIFRADETPLPVDFVSPVDLPQDEGGFYVEYIRGRDYRPVDIDISSWTLQLIQTAGGETIAQTELTFDTIASMYPDEEQTFFNTFQCVGNTPGGALVSNGYFTGVPLRRYLLDVPGMDTARAKRVYFRCFDGYHTNHTIERILNDDPTPIYLVYRFDGLPLNDRIDGSLKHGYPVRIVCQDMMGMKSPKALMQIEVSDSDEVRGHWESRVISRNYDHITWSDKPYMLVNSKIFSPVNYQLFKGSTCTFQVAAWSGRNPVAQVQVGIAPESDSGTYAIRWFDALPPSRPTLTDRPDYDTGPSGFFEEALGRTREPSPWPAPFVWSFWTGSIPLESEGTFRVFARATDTAGDIQPLIESGEARKDGNNGVHSVLIQVKR